MKAALAVMLACVGLGGCVFYLNPQCTDQIKNGEETGVDCGGTCGHCDFGQGCRVNNDCDGANCVSGICNPPPCENGVFDGDETDIDCGGPTCRKCSGARHCEVATDCFGTCVAGPKVCSSIAVSFANEVRYPSGFKSYAIFADNLDGDSDIDLVVANEYGSSVSVFLNNAGTFMHVMNTDLTNPANDDPSFPNFPTSSYPTGVVIAKLDADGRPDVITADYHGDSVTVLLNAATGPVSLKRAVKYPTLSCLGDPSARQGCAETSNLAVGDLNKDGALDVVATNPQRASISVFLGRGDGTLAPATDVPVGITGASMPYSVAIADFNGDGNPDVAIAEEISGTIIVRLGNGDGTFQTEVPFNIGGTRDYIVITGDVNRDGMVDLLCANRGSDSVSVLLGRGDGTFRKAIVTSVRPTGTAASRLFSPYTIAVADFNLDGVPDVITPNFMVDSTTVLLGIGNGHFEEPIETSFLSSAQQPNTTPYGVAAGDFNGDGKADFATANAGSNDLAVKMNTGH